MAAASGSNCESVVLIKLSRNTVAEWFRRGMVIGIDPSSAEYWGPTANHHQHNVEMTALTLALQAARPQLCEPLSREERAQVTNWFSSIRGAGLHRNNHMFFNVMTRAFLNQEGFGRRFPTVAGVRQAGSLQDWLVRHHRPSPGFAGGPDGFEWFAKRELQ